MDIIEKLNTLGQKAEEEFPNLNYGGCCVFASLVADRLAELGIEAGGVVAMDFGGRPPSIDKARSNIHDESDGDEWEENGVAGQDRLYGKMAPPEERTGDNAPRRITAFCGTQLNRQQVKKFLREN